MFKFEHMTEFQNNIFGLLLSKEKTQIREKNLVNLGNLPLYPNTQKRGATRGK
jgi:hypothetical protein